MGCDECDIEQKIHICCGENPETGEQARLVLDDGTVTMACPNLTPYGACSSYHNRPDLCELFHCTQLMELDVYDMIMQRIGSK